MKKLLLVLLLSIASVSLADEKIKFDSSIKNWSLIGDSRLITRGETVWGHQFGFMKDQSVCDHDILLIAWSTEKKGLEKFKGKDAFITINIDGEELDSPLEFTLMTTGPLDSLTLAYFGAIVVSDSFINTLKNSNSVELTFSKPKNLVKTLDIKTDTFNTSGLDKVYSSLDNSCS